MYALITRDLTQILKKKSDVVAIPKEDLHPDKPYWVEIQVITDNQATTSNTVMEPTVETIYVDRVERVTVIRDMSEQELLDKQNELKSQALTEVSNFGIIKALGSVLFQLTNDVRALNSQQPITKKQFIDHIKTLL